MALRETPSFASATAPVRSAGRTDPDARRLVVGAAIGFGIPQVRVFIESLRATGYGGDVMILVRWPGITVGRYLKNRGVTVLRVFQTRSFTRSVHARRYALYLDYLRAHSVRYDQVMMSDVRDVVFQSNPFDRLAGSQCHFYLESAARSIGEDTANSRWVRGCLSADEAQALAPCRISCSGITIGGTAALIVYLERMVARVREMPFRIYRSIGHGYDQAIHNCLVHLDPEIDGVLEENNRHIATMALEPRASYRLDSDGSIRSADGELFPICHQYDRFPDIRAAIEARFSPG